MPDVIGCECTYAFAYRDGKILVGGSDEAPTIPVLDVPPSSPRACPATPHFLGNLERYAACVALTLPGRRARASQGCAMSACARCSCGSPTRCSHWPARAFQVVEWDRTHRYCGRCGTPTRQKADERAKECPKCGYVAYPRVSPAMMALVTRGREILLARSHRFVNGVYSALAGFVEPGETIEDCVRREVREEVGVEIDDITYFASQSWAFPHSLMIAYTAEYAGGEIRLEDAEIADARWFSRR